MKKLRIAAISILLLAVVALIVRANSFTLALRFAGFYPGGVNTLESGIDNNGEEFRVIQTSSDKQNMALAYLVQNKLGLWTVSYRVEAVPADAHIVSIGWMRSAGFKWFVINSDDTRFETEWHQLYCGDNAVKPIAFLPGQIPEKVAVNIRQAGNIYSIHVISFEDPDVLNKLDVHGLLLKAGCLRE